MGHSKIKKRNFYLGVVASFFPLALLFFIHESYKFNMTASMPLGLYKRASHAVLERGSIVAFCLPKTVAREGFDRGYIHSGICPGHTQMLLKEVIALPGDTIILTSHDTVVLGHGDYLSPKKLMDHNHYPVTQFIHTGIFRAIHGYWMYGFNDPIHSWDSRYYGAIVAPQLRGVYHLVLSF